MFHPSFSWMSMTVVLSLAALLGGCSDEKTSGDTAASDAAAADDGETGDDTAGPDDEPGTGNPEGDPIGIDHDRAVQTVRDNLTLHMDGLEQSIDFLEDSAPVNSLYELLFGEDEEDEEPPAPPEEPEEGATKDGHDEAFDIDLSEMRDGLIDTMVAKMMLEPMSTVADDGLSIAYAVDPATFCEEEAEEDESEDDAAERAEDEADCTERLTANPFGMTITSDAIGDVNLSMTVGATALEVLDLQLHDDQISAHIDMGKLKTLVEVFISPEDFELPQTMEGVVGVEVRRNDAQIYTARFVVSEDIHIEPNDDQEPLSLEMSQADAPGSITFDGQAMTIDGSLAIDPMEVGLPWQMIVDMLHDGEGETETVCETDEETGEEECREETTEPTEPPEVDDAMVISLPGVTGTLAYNSTDDAFVLTGVSLGDATTTVMVDGEPIIELDLNPDNGRTLDIQLGAPGADDLGLIFSPDFEAQISFAWDSVQDAFEDLPDLFLGDTLGVRFGESDTPEFRLLDVHDDIQLQVAHGQATFWSSNMDEDVVIEEGECIGSIDDDTLTEEERDAQHELFGGWIGTSCED
jgi:hypothetical protein